MQVVVMHEALAEVREACRWYDERVPGLGTEFARAVDAAISAAARRPDAFPMVEGELRRILLRRFPYSIGHGIDAGKVSVVAGFHHPRDPKVLYSRRTK
ncbi:MAG: type II toxin-antitoxin system RelE/ParE family toxin [Burkholderiaceae bacterium]